MFTQNDAFIQKGEGETLVVRRIGVHEFCRYVGVGKAWKRATRKDFEEFEAGQRLAAQKVREARKKADAKTTDDETGNAGDGGDGKSKDGTDPADKGGDGKTVATRGIKTGTAGK